MKPLSDLEQELMNIVWQKKTCTVREVLSELNKRRKLAYTTVMTIMSRMVEKDVLVRKRKTIGYVYEPKVTKENFIARSVHNVVRSTISSFGTQAISYFVKEIGEMKPNQRKILLELLKKK